MNINQILNSALLNEEAGEFGGAEDVKKSGGFEGFKQGVKDFFINDPTKLELQRKKKELQKEDDKKYYAQSGEFGEVTKDDSDSQPGSKVKAGNSDLNNRFGGKDDSDSQPGSKVKAGNSDLNNRFGGKDDSDSQPGSKVKAGNSDLNNQITKPSTERLEPSKFEKLSNALSNAGNQAKEFYSQHKDPINVGLGAAALGGLGYLAYKKLKKNKQNVK